MNYIKHLTGFFDKVAKDKLLNPTHVSLYIALFQFWNINRFRNPISISRHEIMRISKISSLATYHRCLKLLDAHGYIKYEPSFNPYKGSHVFLFNFADDLKPTARNERTATSIFEHVDEQVVNKHRTSTETASEQVSEQALVPYINNTNNPNILNDSNSLNLDEPAKKIENESFDFLKNNGQEKEKSSAKKEMPEHSLDGKPQLSNPAFADSNAQQTENRRQKDSIDLKADSFTEQESVEHVRHLFANQIEKPPENYSQKPLPNPTVEEVINYFREQNYPEIEANKFFNYFKSIGWLVGGKTPMADWPAAARNWMLNAPKFVSNERTDRIKSLDTSAGKDYSEPL
jgi:hypothetical protein